MNIVKSYSVGEGDMFYISHISDSFTVIDCCYDKNDEDKFDSILAEIREISKEKSIFRFISTHPDEDHIRGLKKLNEKFGINNFYCTENKAVKEEATDDFNEYCKLRDGKTHYYLYKDCKRKWLNDNSEERGSAGVSIYWPIVNNNEYMRVLENVKQYRDYNNLSPIIRYSIKNSAKFLWMGDMENDFREKIQKVVDWPKVNVLFAPHHGRKSGRVSKDILDIISPQLIIVGEAPSEDLEYYDGYNTLTQNSTGDITFVCDYNYIHIYVENDNYESNISVIENKHQNNLEIGNYIGSIRVN